MKKILVFQHAAHEKLGTFEKEIRSQGFEYETLWIPDLKSFPSAQQLESYAALIVLGGPQSVCEEREYPWMKHELLLIREALRIKMPILGICLGAQLLARAAGAPVRKGPIKEIGWGWIRFDDWFSKRNPLTFQFDLTKPHPVFQWHGDMFDIPVEGYSLAWNDNYPGQMFVFQGNAIGIQFHPEMTQEMVREWVDQGRDEIIRNKNDPYRIVEETQRYLPNLEKLCHRFFYGFASLIRENIRRAA